MICSCYRYLRSQAARHAAVVAMTILVFAAPQAHAEPWIPDAGSGEIVPMLRYDYADQAFPADSFSTATVPSSKENKTQIRVTGAHGLGDGFSLDYDLRYGFVYRSKTRNGITQVDTNDGLQDQKIGIGYGLTQTTKFADSVSLYVIIPGSSAARIPGLDSGHWALEADYAIGLKPGFRNVTATWEIGSRVFTDGGVAQFRTELEVGAPVLHDLRLAGTLFFVRSARLGAYDELRDQGELYNLLRTGVTAKYRLADRVEPFVAYEDYVAGMGGHASQRFTLGVTIKY